MKETLWPKVGVGVIIFRGKQILLGKRLHSHGENAWAPPGGHIEPFETPVKASIREIEEETGLRLETVKPGPWVNTVFEKENKHYITLFMFAPAPLGAKPELLEPDKCKGWEWFAYDNLPKPLFLPLRHLLEQDPTVFLSYQNT